MFKSFPPLKLDNESSVVNLLRFKQLKFEKEDPHKIFFKYDFDVPLYKFFDLTKVRRNTTPKVIGSLILKPLLPKEKEISAAKLNDLKKLCSLGIIPIGNQEFFNSLKSGQSVPDNLNEPDQAESDTAED